MLVKDILDELNKQYQVGHIGQPRKIITSTLRLFLQNGGKNKRCLAVNEKTKFSTIAFICSASQKKPVKFVNETVGILSPTWTVREYFYQLKKRCVSEPADKKSVVLKLIAAAEFFSDIDWVLRVLKNSKIRSEKKFIEQLRSAIFNSSLPLDNVQRLTLHTMLIKELTLTNKDDKRS